MIKTGEKVATIMQRFAPHMAGAVLFYLFSIGIDNVKQITDEDIKNVKGNALMTDDFSQSLVKTAREIAKQCDLFEDILPFIVCQLPNMNCQTEEIAIWKQDGEENWENLREVFADDVEQHWGYEWDELDRIVLQAVVTDVQGERTNYNNDEDGDWG